jgi:hypothetical protein
MRYSRVVASRVAEPMSMEVSRGEMAPAEMRGLMTPSAIMPGEMPTKMLAEVAIVAVVAVVAVVTEVAIVAEVTAVEAPEVSKAAKAAKAAKAMKTVKAPAKAMKTASAETVKTAPAETVKAAATPMESSASAPKGRGFAHDPRRDARCEGGFEHESESNRRRDDFRPFASHDALLPRPPSLNRDLPETAPNPVHSQFFRRLIDYLAGRPMSSIRMTKI